MILLVIFLSSVCLNLVNGLTCYQCIASSVFDPCVTDNGVAVGCDKKYCTIFRRELLDPVGTIVQFYRSCQNSPQYKNAETTDENYRTFYHACTTDVCNTGEGRMKPSSINPIKEEQDKLIIVPGIGSTALTRFSSNYKLLCIVISVWFFNANLSLHSFHHSN